MRNYDVERERPYLKKGGEETRLGSKTVFLTEKTPEQEESGFVSTASMQSGN